MAETPEQGVDKLLVDPPHHRDESEPCWSCRAHWARGVMQHTKDCEFMDADDEERFERE